MLQNGHISDLIGVIKDSPIINLQPKEVSSDINSFKVIDVRGKDEFFGDLGHIEGATLLTIDGDFSKNIAKFDKNIKYLFVCKLGGRSSRACREAQILGFKNIYNLDGGMVNWNDQGLKTSNIA